MATTAIALRSCRNLRDLGGCRTLSGRRVRPGVLFRSDSFHKLTADDAALCVRTLGPRTLIDLRSIEELLRLGAGPRTLNAHHLHMPISVEPVMSVWRRRRKWSLIDVYMRMADRSGPVVAEIVRALGVAEALPAVIFCAAGKDRTGVTTALVLGALNVSDEDIVDDYAATSPVDPTLLGAGYAESLREAPQSFLEASPDTMRGFLAAMRRKYGSVRVYMARNGVHRGDLLNLERALLERD
ncbi:MAG TPA: tyrosine-protein phosphatase [Actinomycetota bacterium]|jgi:protein-tyrosine phosphatase|nr:tyrosine-protein phosphatase [Actinomycetota bacterium]